MDVVRIGIVGSGYMGKTYAETTTRFNQGTQLVAVTGGRRAPALADQYGVDAEPSVEALVSRSDIDAVILAMPEQSRLAYARLAAAAGKHILSEKPMAPTVAECDAILATCRQAGVKLMSILTGRYRGVQRRAKGLIDAGRIGKVWMVRSIATATQEDYRGAAQDKPWLTDPAGGGFFYDMGAHQMDMLRWLTGQEPRRLFAKVTTYSDLPWHDMTAVAQVDFDGGATAHLLICNEMPGVTFPSTTFASQVIGDKGLLDFDMYGSLKLGVDGHWETVWTQPTFDYIKDPNSPIRLEAHAAVTQEFADCILEDREPATTGADGRTAVAMCETAMISSRTGQPVLFPY